MYVVTMKLLQLKHAFPSPWKSCLTESRCSECVFVCKNRCKIIMLLVDVGLRSLTSFQCPTRCRHQDALWMSRFEDSISIDNRPICDGSEFQCDTTLLLKKYNIFNILPYFCFSRHLWWVYRLTNNIAYLLHTDACQHDQSESHKSHYKQESCAIAKMNISRVGIVGGVGGGEPPSSCLQTLIFEWKSALNFNPWAKFQTFRQLTPQFF